MAAQRLSSNPDRKASVGGVFSLPDYTSVTIMGLGSLDAHQVKLTAVEFGQLQGAYEQVASNSQDAIRARITELAERASINVGDYAFDPLISVSESRFYIPGVSSGPLPDGTPVEFIVAGVSNCLGAALFPQILACQRLFMVPKRWNGYASAGIGSSLHLAAELFKSLAGVDIRHILIERAECSCR